MAADPAHKDQTPSDGSELPEPDAAFQRVMVFIVALLGLAIFAALGAIVLRVIYLSGQTEEQALPEVPARVAEFTKQGDAGKTEAGQIVSGQAMAGVQIPLVAGAKVQSMALDGDRLAVHYDGPEGAGILVLDTKTGKVLQRFTLRVP